METISPSKITTYLMCPRKYAFRYVEGATPAWKSSALAFGSAVHSALEVFHQKRQDGETPAADTIVEVFRSDWAAQQVDDLHFKPKEDTATLADQGEALVSLYVEEHADLQVVAAEWPFQVPLHDPETGEILGPDLKGILDLVLWSDVIVEIKTAARAYDEGTLARNLQFSAYAYAYRQVVHRDPTLRVVALLKQKKPRIESYEVTRTTVDDTRFVRVAAAVAHAIEAEAFPPNPDWGCTDCEYQTACAAWRGPNPKPAVVPVDHRHEPTTHEGATP